MEEVQPLVEKPIEEPQEEKVVLSYSTQALAEATEADVAEVDATPIDEAMANEAKNDAKIFYPTVPLKAKIIVVTPSVTRGVVRGAAFGPIRAVVEEGKWVAAHSGTVLAKATVVSGVCWGVTVAVGAAQLIRVIRKLYKGEITREEFIQKCVQITVSTGSAIGVASLCAFAGAALGSVIPGIGTVIGGLVGACVGGLIGSFGGEKLVQYIQKECGWIKPTPQEEVYANALNDLKLREKDLSKDSLKRARKAELYRAAPGPGLENLDLLKARSHQIYLAHEIVKLHRGWN